MEKLTVEKLKSMSPNERFAMGVTTNSPDGVYMLDTNEGRELLWVAKRGGIHDWCIYCDWAVKGTRPTTPEEVAKHGQKVIDDKNIKKLVDCDDEAFALYRF